MTTSALSLILAEQSENRARYAKSAAEKNDAQYVEQNQMGAFLGVDANTGKGLVKLDSGGTIPASVITNGSIKAGQRVFVQVQGGVAWLDAMPS